MEVPKDQMSTLLDCGLYNSTQMLLDSKHEAANAYVDAGHCYKKTNSTECIKNLEISLDLFMEIGRLGMSARYCKSAMIWLLLCFFLTFIQVLLSKSQIRLSSSEVSESQFSQVLNIELDQIIEYAGENIVFGSGSPFDHVDLGNGKVGHVNQANNMYLFPGVGLGSLLSGAHIISDGMLQAASECLASYMTEEEIQMGRLYPSIKSIRHITAEVGAAVVRAAVAEELAEGHGEVGPRELAHMSKFSLPGSPDNVQPGINFSYNNNITGTVYKCALVF